MEDKAKEPALSQVNSELEFELTVEGVKSNIRQPMSAEQMLEERRQQDRSMVITTTHLRDVLLAG